MSRIAIDEFNSKLLRPYVAKIASFCRLTNRDRYSRPEITAYPLLAPSHASVNGGGGGALLNVASLYSARPRGSDFRCLGKRKRIIDVHAEVSNGVFDLGVSKQYLTCSRVCGNLELDRPTGLLLNRH